jgi:hypothetical protein
MDGDLRRLLWEERLEGRVYTCRFGARHSPGCSIVAAIGCAVVLLFLAHFGPLAKGGGGLVTLALLQMAIPIAITCFVAFFGDADGVRLRVVRIDPDRLVYTKEHGRPELVVATAEVREIVAARWGGVEIVDHRGKTLVHLATCAPKRVAAHLAEGLAAVRAPRTYRG